MLREDAERLLAGLGILALVRRLALACRGERLVDRDLHAGHLAALSRRSAIGWPALSATQSTLGTPSSSASSGRRRRCDAPLRA